MKYSGSAFQIQVRIHDFLPEGASTLYLCQIPPPQKKHEICWGGTRTVLSEVRPCGVFKLPGIEIDADTHKNGLYRIVWVCLDCTETEPTLDSIGFCANFIGFCPCIGHCECKHSHQIGQ